MRGLPPETGRDRGVATLWVSRTATGLRSIQRGIMEAMKIHIPTPLRAYTDKKETVTVEAATVADALAALTAAHPGLQQHLFSPEGKLRSFVNVYLNEDDVRYLPSGESTAVTANDELTIIPSIAGGASSVPAGCCR
jgi:molybdopterin synthase sulfur carrier subunit